MSVTITINDRPIKLNIGSKLKLNKRGSVADLGRIGDIAKIVEIRLARHVTDSKILIVRIGNPHLNWGNLDGMVPNRTGMQLYLGDLLHYFDLSNTSEKVYISKDLTFKNRNLKGLDCKMLATLPNGDRFVEFKEDIGGCSCDGLGKRGHCITVDEGLLAERKEPTPKKKKVKKED